jgi:signal transduction histidine kinase
MSAGSERHFLLPELEEGEQQRSNLSFQDVKNVLLFAVAYLAAFGYSSFFAQNASAPLWFPDSVLLCALLLAPKKKWWLYILAALPIRFLPGLRPHVPFWFLWGTFANDAVKASIAAYLLRFPSGNFPPLNTLRRFTRYLVIAVLALPMLSALFGAAARFVLGYPFWTSCQQWFLGNALTNLVITPMLLEWSTDGYRQLRSRLAEVGLWTAGFVACLRYTVLLSKSNESPIALYAPMPFLIWAATRFGTIGASSALSLLALFLMMGVARGSLQFLTYSGSQDVYFVQLFLGLTSLPILFVAILIQERQEVGDRLRESQEELNKNYKRVRELVRRLITAQEDERERIGRDLHDDVCQRLAVLMWGLEGLARGLSPRMGPEQSKLTRLRQDVEAVLDSVRELSHQLHSATLRHLGLTSGLERLCKTIAQQHHVQVDVIAEPILDLPDDVSLCLFRVVQEALDNAINHGKAKQITVTLTRGEESVCLEIRDSGTGFNPAAESDGLGLVSMRERLFMVGGELVLQSFQGQGTVIQAIVNCPAIEPSRKAIS